VSRLRLTKRTDVNASIYGDAESSDVPPRVLQDPSLSRFAEKHESRRANARTYIFSGVIRRGDTCKCRGMQFEANDFRVNAARITARRSE